MQSTQATLTVDPNVSQASQFPEGNVPEFNGIYDTFSATRPFDSVMTPKLECLGDFLQKYPSGDGRGVTIAVLDTGIDPKMEGMQITTTGERKIINMFDCSGAGDVICSTSVSSKDGFVTGLTGRSLNVGAIKGLHNPSGKFYLGIKPIHELYVKSLKTTMEKEKHAPNWESSSNLALADARRLLQEHEDAVGGKATDRKQRLKREDLACRIDLLKENLKKEDKGPVADVVLWSDGKTWKALLDTSFRGKLGMCKAMGSYSEAFEFGEGTVDGDQLTYSFNIYADEKKVEIVTSCGTHGSHVASIAAANYPHNPDLNGLAPGAKVVSICIGDARLGSTETGTALTRAFNICRDMGVDVINMSYGECVDFNNSGRIIDEIKKMLEKGKSVFLSSAGNNGPALSSVGCPGGTTNGIISVGALLLPNQLKQLYGTAADIDEPKPFMWSSCGPASDGAEGLSVYAPGAAFAEVPRYTRKSHQLMNGTSMSSPNAAGAVACLISQLKADKKSYSPYEVRLALEQSAKPLKGCLAGMLSVPDAYNFLSRNEAIKLNLYDIEVGVKRWGIPERMRGIYLREAADFTSTPLKFNIRVDPQFVKSATPEEKTHFLERLTLELQGGHNSVPHTSPAIKWEIPDVVNLSSSDCSFSVLMEYDSKLDIEKKHVKGWIAGIDRNGRAVFRVPYAILPPIHDTKFEVELCAGVIERRLIHVPEKQNIACIQINHKALQPNERVFLHGLQNVPDLAMRSHELHKNFISEKDTEIFLMKVVPGRSLELCTTLSTLSYKKVKASININFYNILHDPTIHLTTGSVCNRFFVETVSDLPVEFDPSLSLKSLVSFYKPTEMKIEPLHTRDLFADGIQINNIQLVYKISTNKSGDCQFEISGLSEYLYELPYDHVFFQIFSTSKEFIGASSSFRDRYSVKLEKGEYRVHVQVRHPEEAMLERLKDAVLTVHQKLPSPISMYLYRTLEAQAHSDSQKKWAAVMLAQTQRASMFVAQMADEKLGKPPGGTQLRGEFSLFGGTWKNAKYTVPVVLHVVAPESKQQSKALSMVELEAPNKEKDTPMKELTNALRDVRIKHIEKIDKLEDAEKVYNEARTNEIHFPLEVAFVKKLGSLALVKDALNEVRDKFIKTADEVIATCKADEVLAYFGTQNTDATVELASKKENFEQRKDALIKVLTEKVSYFATKKVLRMKKSQVPSHLWETAQKLKENPKETMSAEEDIDVPIEFSDSSLKVTDSPNNSKCDESAELEAAFVELQKFAPLDDSKLQLPYAKYAIANELHAIALRALEKHINEARAAGKTPEADERTLSELASLCGWDHLATAYRNDFLHRVRTHYRPF